MSRPSVSLQPLSKTTGSMSSDQGGSLVTVKRFDASCSRVISSANLVCAFRYSTEGKKWDKLNIEGPLFLYERDDEPPFALFILNKNSLRNWGCVLDESSELQERDRYLLIQVRSDIPSGNANAANAAAKGIHMICFRSVSKCQEFCDIIRENTRLKVLVVNKNQKFAGLNEKNDGVGGDSGGDDTLNTSFGGEDSFSKAPNIMDSPLTTTSSSNIGLKNASSSNNRNTAAWIAASQQQQPNASFGKPSDSAVFSASAGTSSQTPANANLLNLQQFLAKVNPGNNNLPGGGVSHTSVEQQQFSDSANRQPAPFKPYTFGEQHGGGAMGGLAQILQQTHLNPLQQQQQQPSVSAHNNDGPIGQQAERERMFAKLNHNLTSARVKKTGSIKHGDTGLESGADLINLTHGLETADKSASEQQHRPKSNVSNATGSTSSSGLHHHRPQHPLTSIEQLLNISGITAANFAQILKDAGLNVNVTAPDEVAGDTNGRSRVGGVLGGLRYDSDGYSGGSSSAEHAATAAAGSYHNQQQHKHKRTDSDSTIGSGRTARGGGGGGDGESVRSMPIGNNHNIDPRLLGLGLTEAQFSAAFRFMLLHDEPFVKDLLFTTFKPVMGEPEFINKLHQAYSAALLEQIGGLRK